MTYFKKYLEIIQEEEELKKPKIMPKIMGLLMMFPSFGALSKDLKKDVIKEIKSKPNLEKELQVSNLKEQENYDRLQKRINEIIVNKKINDYIKRVNNIDESEYGYADREFKEVVEDFESFFNIRYEKNGFRILYPFNENLKKEFIDFLETYRKVSLNN